MTYVRQLLVSATVVVALGVATLSAYAVPYASGVRNTAGTTWEFITNEAADNVTVLRNGGNALNLGALPAGRHTFSMAGFNTFDIQVSKSAPVGWAAISNPANLWTNYERPNDVVINNNPLHPLFGTIYVSQGTADTTASGRSMGDGVYALTSDMIGVDLPTRAALVDPNDTSAAKAPNWSVIENTASPWKMTLDAGGNLIVSDWGDQKGGIKYASPDLSTGGLVLKFEDGVTPLLDDGFGEIHGSIVSRPYVTGQIGNNLTVYAIDEDQDSDGETAITTDTGNHLWKWTVGNGTDYNQPPQLVINTDAIQRTSDNRRNFLPTNVGRIANAFFSPQYNKWYLTESSSNGEEGGLLVVTADGVDGNSPTLDWSSFQFSIDNNLDGNTALEGIQDSFRQMGGGFQLSADGTKLYLHKMGNDAANPVLGSASNTPGAVLVIPLDANGIPNLQVSGGQITNLQSFTTQENDAGATRRGLSIDAAGNVYTTNNFSELLEVFSPGGNWMASTTSAGIFNLTPLAPPGNDADFDNDGRVDGADLLIWQRGLGAAGDNSKGDADASMFVDGADLAVWKLQFGLPAIAAAAPVPEPATGTIIAFAGVLLGLGALRRDRTVV
jgi:hypothetical protein